MRAVCLSCLAAAGLLWGAALGSGVRTARAEEGEFVLRASVSSPGIDGSASLTIRAELPRGWSSYALAGAEEPQEGPTPTRIELDASPDFRLAGSFEASPPPSRVRDANWPELTVFEHTGSWRWTAPIVIAPGADPRRLVIRGRVVAQRNKGDDGSLAAAPFPFEARVNAKNLSSQPIAAESSAPRAVASKPVAERPRIRVSTVAQKKAAGDKPGAAKDKPGEHRNPKARATIRGQVSPKVVEPGGKLTLELSAEPDEHWHVYEWRAIDGGGSGSKPTLIVVDEPSQWSAGAPTTQAIAQRDPTAGLGGSGLKYYEGRATWTVEIDLPADAAAGKYTLAGAVGYQTCEKQCIQPLGAEFTAEVTVGAKSQPGAVPLNFVEASYVGAVNKRAKAVKEGEKKPAGEPQKVGTAAPGDDGNGTANAAETPRGAGTDNGPDEDTSLSAGADGGIQFDLAKLVVEGPQGSAGLYFVLAFIGGLILNVMPCVLPVIGLKAMSFVQQAGEHRGRIFALNVWYAAGSIAVFMVLATLAVLLKLNWGGQFQQAWFNCALTLVVFVCSLSFLGVWEIPVPGMASSKAAGNLARREGPLGAFAKGVLTTVLATPCTGPFMGPALAWSATQPAAVTYATFFFLGLGMSSPFLVLGAFPRALKLLPKPGQWMETFKQFSGFVLLGTGVYLMTIMPAAFVVPTIVACLGVGLGCWWYGRAAYSTEGFAKARLVAISLAFALGGMWVGFALMQPVMERRFKLAVRGVVAKTVADSGGTLPKGIIKAFEDSKEGLPWEPYSRDELVRRVSEGQTVLVDFTANWCPNCIVNEAVAFNTTETRRVVEELGVVPLLADLTDENPDPKLLEQLKNPLANIPFCVIFPAGRPHHPIILDGPLTNGKVIDALRQSGSSNSSVARHEEKTLLESARSLPRVPQ